MSYGQRFVGVKGEVRKAGFGPIPFGWYTAQITSIKEAPNGDLVDITLELFHPSEFKGRFVKFISIYCGENNKHGDRRKDKYIEEMSKHVAKLIETQGYTDLALNPKLATTHKPLAMFSDVQMFKSRRFLAYIGQEEYDKDGEIRIKNTFDDFMWWDGQMAPAGPDKPQPLIRKLRVDRDAPPRGSRRPDYSGTGAEDDQGPSGDYAGGYASDVADTSVPWDK